MNTLEVNTASSISNRLESGGLTPFFMTWEEHKELLNELFPIEQFERLEGVNNYLEHMKVYLDQLTIGNITAFLYSEYNLDIDYCFFETE